MTFTLSFFIKSIMLGIGLAMDAFSVSMANGLNETNMKTGKMLTISGIFAGFQALMPMIGWICVHTMVQMFSAFEKFIPWIALILLSYIGGKMLFDGIREKEENNCNCKTTICTLLVQGIATSIDALSVGFTISDYNLVMALICAVLIAAVTFIICMAGIFIGKKFGTRLADKASILGGTILIVIGIEIFINGIL